MSGRGDIAGSSPGSPDLTPGGASDYGRMIHMPALLSDLFGISRSEARRCINQRGVHLNDSPMLDFDLPCEWVEGRELRLGRRRVRWEIVAGVSNLYRTSDGILCDLRRAEDRHRLARDIGCEVEVLEALWRLHV